MRGVRDGQDYIEVVNADQAAARELGAGGVPFFVLDNKVGLSRAQTAGVFPHAREKTAQKASVSAAIRCIKY